MKKVNIRNVNAPDTTSVFVNRKLYSIYLGNGENYSFTSKKNTLAFTAALNRHINACVYEFNMLYSQLFAEYRENWYYFLSDMQRANTDLIRIEQQVRKNFDSVNVAFERLIHNTRGINGNYYVYTFLDLVCKNLTEIANQLAVLHRKRSNMAQVTHMHITATRLQQIKAAAYTVPATALKFAATVANQPG